jgi:hypothetical protein
MSDPLPKRQADGISPPLTPEWRENMKGKKSKYVRRQYTLDDFCFNLSTGLILHRPSGAMWVPARVDKAIPAVEVDGKSIAPSEWLKQQARKHGR